MQSLDSIEDTILTLCHLQTNLLARKEEIQWRRTSDFEDDLVIRNAALVPTLRCVYFVRSGSSEGTYSLFSIFLGPPILSSSTVLKPYTAQASFLLTAQLGFLPSARHKQTSYPFHTTCDNHETLIPCTRFGLFGTHRACPRRKVGHPGLSTMPRSSSPAMLHWNNGRGSRCRDCSWKWL